MKGKINFLVIFIGVVMLPMALEAQSGLPRVAVLPFTSANPQDGQTAATLFAGELNRTRKLGVLPRTAAATAILQEMGLERTGLTDPDSIIAYGKQVHADFVAAGDIQTIGSRKLIHITMLNVTTLEQVGGDYQEYAGDEAAIRQLLPQMAQKLASGVNRNTRNLPVLAVVPFMVPRGIDARAAQTLAQLLATDITNSGAYVVLPRTKSLDDVMKEYKNQRSGLSNTATARGPGQGRNPDLVLSGEVASLGNNLKLFVASILRMDGIMHDENASADIQYRDISDGIEKMADLSYQLTGKKSAAVVNREALQDRQRVQQRQQEKQAVTAHYLKPTGLVFGVGIGGSVYSIANQNGFEGLGAESNEAGFDIPAHISIEAVFAHLVSMKVELNYGFLGRLVWSWFEYYDFQIPVLIQFTFFRDGAFFLTPYLGIGFNILTSAAEELMAIDTSPLSFLIGGSLGIGRKTSTHFFIDLRYAADLGKTEVKAKVFRGIGDTFPYAVEYYEKTVSFKHSAFNFAIGVGIPINF